MKRISVFIFCVTLVLLSCRKKTADGSGPTAHKNPMLNDTEKAVVGVWTLDSTSTYDASNVYVSHTIPNPSVTEPKVAFYEAYDCGNCSEMGYYLAGQGTTPGKYDPAVWSAPTSDTLKLGPVRVYMASYKIVTLNNTNMVIRSKASNGNISTSYYHRS